MVPGIRGTRSRLSTPGFGFLPLIHCAASEELALISVMEEKELGSHLNPPL